MRNSGLETQLHHAAKRPFCACQTVSFLPIALKPQHRPRTWVHLLKRRFQRCIVRTEVLSTFHARVEYISVTKYAIETIGPMGQTTPKSTPSISSVTWTRSNTQMLGNPTHHHMTSIITVFKFFQNDIKIHIKEHRWQYSTLSNKERAFHMLFARFWRSKTYQTPKNECGRPNVNLNEAKIWQE